MRLAVLAGFVLIAGCDRPEPAASPSPAITAGGAAIGAAATPSPQPGATGTAATPATAIPASLHGRWGLVPADCTSTRGDNKGLLEVGPQTLRFYESRGTLGEGARASERSVRASFAFVGEGMEWTREMELRLLDGPDPRLQRTEFGPEAMPEPLIYERCPA